MLELNVVELSQTSRQSCSRASSWPMIRRTQGHFSFQRNKNYRPVLIKIYILVSIFAWTQQGPFLNAYKIFCAWKISRGHSRCLSTNRWTGRIRTSGELCLKTVTDVDIVLTGVRTKIEFNHTILWINGKCVKYQSCFTWYDLNYIWWNGRKLYW